MTSKTWSVWVVGVFLAAASVAAGASTAVRRADEVRAAVDAMGGKQLLKSIRTIRLEGVGHRNMLEQSLRPDGPWWQDYFELDEFKDFQGHRERIVQKHRGYSSPDWWLQHPSWDGDPYYPAVVVADGAVAKVADGKFSRYSSSYLQQAEEDLAFDPIQLVLGAESSTDLHALPDVQLHGFTHHVVAWTWNGVELQLFLNGYTDLPEELRFVRARPYDVFWNVWGDVDTRVTFGMWALESDGLRYPRQVDVQRNGVQESDLTVTSVTVNPAVKSGDLDIPKDVEQDYIAHKRAIDDLPLGFGGGQVSDILPGLIHIPGAWNVNLIRQPDGIVVLEGPISSAYSKQVLEEAHRRFPDLPVKAVVSTSDSWPHIGGLREYTARGIPIYAPDLNADVLKRLIAAPHSLRPDSLQANHRPPDLRMVSERTKLGAGANRVELIPYRSETGERQMLVYFPEDRLLYTSDLFAPATGDQWFTPEYLLEFTRVVNREKLQVDRIFGMHYDVLPYETVTKALNSYLGGRQTPAISN